MKTTTRVIFVKLVKSFRLKCFKTKDHTFFDTQSEENTGPGLNESVLLLNNHMKSIFFYFTIVFLTHDLLQKISRTSSAKKLVKKNNRLNSLEAIAHRYKINPT